MIDTNVVIKPQRIVPPAAVAAPRDDCTGGPAALTPLAAFCLALWFGLAAGIAELACELIRLALFGRRVWRAPSQ